MSAASKKQSKASAEETDVKVNSAVTPIWLIVLLGVGIYWGQLYLDRYSGGFNPQVYSPYESFAAVENAQPTTGEGQVLAMGEQVYSQACAACHQPHGKGMPGQFPPLLNSDWVLESDPSRLIRMLLHGLQGPIEVNGEQFNNVMPPWKGTYSNEQIAAVLTYIRQREDWGHDASSVPVEQVNQIDSETEGRAQPWTADELQQISVGE